MKHFYKSDEMLDATPVIAHSWVGEDATIPGEVETGIQYKTTRSTLAVEVLDICDLEDEYAVSVFKSLIRLCNTVGRDEIVIESLEDIVKDKDQTICDCFNSIQHAVVRTCRSMNLSPARVSLEKRGQFHDLRIYLTFH